jgi:KipI family sensor histidine kinase inhibitor
MRFLPARDDALLIELPDLAHTLALYRALQTRPIAGTRELVPAARTLLVQYDKCATDALALATALRGRVVEANPDQAEAAQARIVEIPVHYQGEDLPEVAEMMGVSVREVVRRHTGQPWQAAFAGFAPGFVYLAGGHPSFHVARRRTPRTSVPAGSVALAGDFSAVYPTASPGGWQLIGVTRVAMWDLQRAEPAYVQPGFRVQFIDADAAGAHVSLPAVTRGPAPSENKASEPPPTAVDQAQAAIEVLSPGLHTLVQDAGRPGLAGLGISPSGALDRAAMRQANRLVGNPVHTPVLENLLGGLTLRCRHRAVIAVAGAPVPLTLQGVDGRAWPVPSHSAVALDDGDVLTLGVPTAGVRCMVAVRGGWEVEPVLGSCSTDTLGKIGPPALQPGQWLAVGRTVAAHALSAVQAGEDSPPALPRPGDEVVLDVVLGPRTDWFTPEAVALLQHQSWRVTPQSNRIGMRLAGTEPLTRSRNEELPSEGTVAGAIQVPAGGQPVLFLADHPRTGGYPVIAAVASHHLGRAAQIPVGCTLRFRVVAPFKES